MEKITESQKNYLLKLGATEEMFENDGEEITIKQASNLIKKIKNGDLDIKKPKKETKSSKKKETKVVEEVEEIDEDDVEDVVETKVESKKETKKKKDENTNQRFDSMVYNPVPPSVTKYCEDLAKKDECFKKFYLKKNKDVQKAWDYVRDCVYKKIKDAYKKGGEVDTQITDDDGYRMVKHWFTDVDIEDEKENNTFSFSFGNEEKSNTKNKKISNPLQISLWD